MLNLLTNSKVLADDKLFATLDPTTRKIELSNNQPLLLTDTVGFIRKLPHDLVEAFKATLEEAVLADFLIHVIDASNEDAEEHIIATNTVLSELGADKKRTLTIFNKIDKVEDQRFLTRLRSLIPDSHFISVKDTSGIDKLVKDMEYILEEDLDQTELEIPAERYDIIALLHRTSHIFEEEYKGNSVNIRASVPANIHGQIKAFIVTS